MFRQRNIEPSDRFERNAFRMFLILNRTFMSILGVCVMFILILERRN